MQAQPLGLSEQLTGGSAAALTRAESWFIFLRMSSRHTSACAAIELALIGVTALCVADILCS